MEEVLLPFMTWPLGSQVNDITSAMVTSQAGNIDALLYGRTVRITP